jgi:decaprenylphospho-beta-D-ribofuranose 2-oxidase
MTWKQLELTGWGRSSRAACRAARPERPRNVVAAVAQAEERGILAFGAGRSYGDTGLNAGGSAVLTERLNRILAFDETTGEIVVEPGVSFRDLLEVFLPRGFLVPVSPGTAYATIGGAVANDVHGKNHEVVGSFGHHVRWLELLLPSGAIARASPVESPELFAATIGGIGLTGILLAVCFRMTRVPSNAVALRERRVPDLEAFLDALTSEREKAHYSVGWIDALASGGSLGRGILETAEPASEDLPEGSRLSMPSITAGSRARSVGVGPPTDSFSTRWMPCWTGTASTGQRAFISSSAWCPSRRARRPCLSSSKPSRLVRTPHHWRF